MPAPPHEHAHMLAFTNNNKDFKKETGFLKISFEGVFLAFQ